MKKFLFILLFVPFAVNAQLVDTVKQICRTYQNEAIVIEDAYHGGLSKEELQKLFKKTVKEPGLTVLLDHLDALVDLKGQRGLMELTCPNSVLKSFRK